MTFTKLPADIHYALNDYLHPLDCAALSQTCTQLYDIYAPLSWKRCELIKQLIAGSLIGRNDFSTEMRRIPIKVLRNPDKYKWFLNQHVEELLFHFTWSELETEIALWFEKFGDSYTETYPKLKKVTISSERVWQFPRSLENFEKWVGKTATPLLKITTIYGPCYEQPHANRESGQQADTISLYPRPPNTSIAIGLNYLNLETLGSKFENRTIPIVNFGPHGVDTLRIDVPCAEQFTKIMSALDQMTFCKKMVVCVQVSSRSGGFKTSAVLGHLDKIPKVVSKVALEFRIFEFSNPRVNPTNAPSYFQDEIVQMFGQLNLTRVSEFQTYWFGMSSLFDIATFPNLCKLKQLAHTIGFNPLDFRPSNSYLISQSQEIFESITSLTWTFYPAVHLYQFLPHFKHLNHFSVKTTQKFSKKSINYYNLLQSLVTSDPTKYFGSKSLLNSFYKKVEPDQLRFVQDTARTLLAQLPPVEELRIVQDNDELEDSNDESRRFLNLFAFELMLFSLCSSSSLAVFEASLENDATLDAFSYSITSLLNESKSLRYMSVVLGREPRKNWGSIEETKQEEEEAKSKKKGENKKQCDHEESECSCSDIMCSGKVVHRMSPIDFVETSSIFHEYFIKPSL